MTQDVVQVRLPLKSSYLPVLRATVGVLAGAMEFNYDEIMQLRVAVSEVFDLVARHTASASRDNGTNELGVSFVNHHNRLEISVEAPADVAIELDGEEDEESRVLLESLMDEVEFRGDDSAIHMAKYKPGTRPR